MMYLCKCGNFKSAQPFKSAVTKDWICDKCANRQPTPKPIYNHVSAQKIHVASKVRTLEILKRRRTIG